MVLTLEDIDSISRGKKSRKRIGSRATPHHLRRHEHNRLNVAKRQGYLTIKPNDRINIRNIYEKWCCALGRVAVLAKQEPDHDAGVLQMTLLLSVPQTNFGELYNEELLELFEPIGQKMMEEYGSDIAWTRSTEYEAKVELSAEANSDQSKQILQTLVQLTS